MAAGRDARQHVRVPDSPALPQARSQARTLAEAGNLDAARALLAHAVDAGRARLADGDPDLPAALRELAALHRRADDPAAARRVLEEAVAAGQRLPATDPLTVLPAYDLAVVADELANRHVARTHFERVATLGPAALGDDHPAVAHARAYLAGGPPAPAAPFQPTAPAPQAAPLPTVPSPQAVPSLPAGVRAPRSRRPHVLAGLAVVVTLAVVAAIVRPGDDGRSGDEGTTGAAGVPAAAASAAPAGSGLPTSPGVPAASATATASVAAPSAPVSAAPARTVTATPTATRPRAVAPAPGRTVPAPAVRTRIVAPGNGSRVPWPFDARFTVSAADVAATRTVVTLSICVAGRCYLDGKLDIIGDRAAPYTVRLGSTRPEGVGVAWRLRLDRVATQTYADLVAEREAEMAAGTWGDKGSAMSKLNATPVGTLTVVKS